MAVLLSVKHDFARLAATLDDFGRKQLPFAAALALTRSAYQARSDLREAMERTFDRPKPFTLNSLYVEAAKKTKLEANVHFRDFAPKGVPAGKYLRAQILGGQRALKAHERRLAAAGVLPDGMALVPTRYADQDKHGNMVPGQVVKILSALQAQRDSGQNQGAFGGKARGKRRESYFAIVPGRPQGRGARGGGLPPAIYKVHGSALGRIVLPVLVYVKAPPRYAPRFDFDAIAMRSVEENLPLLLGGALERALATAKP
jgi:hypothetical protein